jgi:hypothetical protein
MSEPIPITFDATRGCPQQTVLDVGGRRFTLSLLASTADVAALRSTDATEVLVAGRALAEAMPDTVPDTAANGFESAPPSTLDPSLIAPTLVVRDGLTLIGARRIRVGDPLRFGTTETSPLAFDVTFADLDLTAGSMIRRGDTGAVIAATAQIRDRGVDRYEGTGTSEEGPYDDLV